MVASEERKATELTPRQATIARLIAMGLTDREIAEALGLTQRTAEWHVGRILERLGLTNRAAIAAWAVRHGLV